VEQRKFLIIKGLGLKFFITKGLCNIAEDKRKNPGWVAGVPVFISD